MNDSDPDSPDNRYVVGTAPVNRRTADPRLLEQAPEPPLLAERARQLRQRHELGAPLADLVESGKGHTNPAAVPGTAVGGLVAGTALLPLATAAIFDLGVFLCVLGAVLLALASLSRLALKTGEMPNTTAHDLEGDL